MRSSRSNSTFSSPFRRLRHHCRQLVQRMSGGHFFGSSTKKNGLLMTFEKPDEFSDLVLRVEDQEIFTSRSLLASASPAFRRFILEGSKETRVREIVLPDKKYEDIIEMLECVHPAVMKPITEDNVHTILPLANEFEIHVLLERCECQLMESVQASSSSDKRISHMLLAQQYKLLRLHELCVNQLGSTQLEVTTKASTWSALPMAIREQIMRARIQQLEQTFERLWDRLHVNASVMQPATCNECRQNLREFQEFVYCFRRIDIRRQTMTPEVTRRVQICVEKPHNNSDTITSAGDPDELVRENNLLPTALSASSVTTGQQLAPTHPPPLPPPASSVSNVSEPDCTGKRPTRVQPTPVVSSTTAVTAVATGTTDTPASGRTARSVSQSPQTVARARSAGPPCSQSSRQARVPTVQHEQNETVV